MISKTKTTFTVTFESNGGSTVVAIGGISSGSTITLPAAPTKGKDIFAGWYIDDTSFLNKFTDSAVITDDIIVYAKWITFDSTIMNPGNEVLSGLGLNENQFIEIKTSAGDGFQGWELENGLGLSMTWIGKTVDIYNVVADIMGRIFTETYREREITPDDDRVLAASGPKYFMYFFTQEVDEYSKDTIRLVIRK